jgi:hypothetical protein
VDKHQSTGQAAIGINIGLCSGTMADRLEERLNDAPSI